MGIMIGNTSNLSSTKHTFYDDGFYNVTLNITDNDGDMHQVTNKIQILNVKPVARLSFSLEKPIKNDTVNFLDHSFDDDGEIVKYYWDFGDGANSNENSPSHRYNKPGTYTVVLEVTDDDGESEKVSKYIIIYKAEITNEQGIESIIIYLIYIILFVIIIAFVLMLKKKIG